MVMVMKTVVYLQNGLKEDSKRVEPNTHQQMAPCDIIETKLAHFNDTFHSRQMNYKQVVDVYDCCVGK